MREMYHSESNIFQQMHDMLKESAFVTGEREINSRKNNNSDE